MWLMTDATSWPAATPRFSSRWAADSSLTAEGDGDGDEADDVLDDHVAAFDQYGVLTVDGTEPQPVLAGDVDCSTVQGGLDQIIVRTPPASPIMTVGADRVVRGGMAAGGFMSVLPVAAAAVVAKPAPPMSSGRTPLMRHTDSTDAAAADALPVAVDAADVCAPEFQNADDTDVTTDCRRCWYCCVTDMESVAEEGV